MRSSGVDFLVVGDAYVDVILGELPRVPTIGVDTFAGAYDITLGGSGAITAHGLASLSRSVSFVTSFGDDLFGAFVLDQLERASVRCSNQRRSSGSTGLSVSFSHNGDRGFLSVPMPLAAWDAVPPLVRSLVPAHVHVASHPHIAGLAESLPAILDAARATGSTTSADPAGPADGMGEALSCFAGARRLDILFVNESEARDFAAMPNADAAARQLLLFADLVVIKRGARGAAVWRGEEEVACVDGLDVPCIDPTGAGDTFASAFLHAWKGEHHDRLDVCLEFANAAAAASVGYLGGVRSHADLPALQQRDRHIQGPAERVVLRR